jgi:hypothetical protein
MSLLLLKKHVIKIPGDASIGHEEVEWVEDDVQSTENAKKLFEDKIKLGWQAFKPSGIEGKWAKMDEFDASVEQILMLPLTKKLAGGG